MKKNKNNAVNFISVLLTKKGEHHFVSVYIFYMTSFLPPPTSLVAPMLLLKSLSYISVKITQTSGNLKNKFNSLRWNSEKTQTIGGRERGYHNWVLSLTLGLSCVAGLWVFLFCPQYAAYLILVPWAGLNPRRPLQATCRVLTTEHQMPSPGF